jgi:aminoglycoside phosphotransferase (APT) family kinase protein
MVVVDLPPRRVASAERRRRRTPLWEFVDASGLQSVVLGVSKDPNAKVSVLLVSPLTGRAELVVKLATSGTAALAVEREQRTLAEVRLLLPEPLRATLPRPVEMVEFEGRPAMVATALAGRPMTVSYLERRHTADRGKVALDLELAATWLAGIQSATATTPRPIAFAADLDALLRRRFPDEPRHGPPFAALAELQARLSAVTTARTVVHGDFWFGNVLLRNKRLAGVVDWEAAEVSGEPVRDLARFAISYALYLDHRTRRGRRVQGHELRAGAWGAPVEFALDGRGWFPELFRGFLEDGLRRLGAPTILWRDVALAGVAELAARSDDEDFARRNLDLFQRLALGRPGGNGAAR